MAVIPRPDAVGTAVEFGYAGDGAGPRYLSPLTEAGLFGEPYEVLEADNARLRLVDAAGRRHDCIDLMSAYGAVNFGHCNPAIGGVCAPPVDLVACFVPPEAGRLAAWLCSRLGLDDHNVLFQVGGAAGVSAALALAARRRPGRVLTIAGGFHGLSVDSLVASDASMRQAVQATPLLDLVQPSFEPLAVGTLPRTWNGVSTLLYEPVQGAAGYVPLDPDWLRALIAEAHAHDVTVVADEIQAGYYRHGSLSASRAVGLEPDILVFSKSMTNGLFPMAAVCYPAWINELYASGPYLSHTFQTSAIGFRAAYAVARYVDTGLDLEAVAGVSAHLASVAASLRAVRGVADVHATGPTLSFGVPAGRAGEIVRRLLDEGVLAFTGGRRGERVRVAPPLTIPFDELSWSTSALVETVTALHRAC